MDTICGRDALFFTTLVLNCRHRLCDSEYSLSLFITHVILLDTNLISRHPLFGLISLL
jgi:hypothetical protein